MKCVKVRALFAKNKVRFARAEQHYALVQRCTPNYHSVDQRIVTVTILTKTRSVSFTPILSRQNAPEKKRYNTFNTLISRKM